jgi:CRISPR/Cas system endoribonuclease Cas6 (RAMP superfamily)
MALRIRNNKDIKGFQIKIDEQTHSIKISQLADDTTLYFNSKNDISGIIKALMISTLPNIERFRFDHDKNKLFIFSIFFSQLIFSHSM